MPIAQGVIPQSGYVDPASGGGGVALGVTPQRELLTADASSKELLVEIVGMLEEILTELQLHNELLHPAPAMQQGFSSLGLVGGCP